jgi:hypothetical protein
MLKKIFKKISLLLKIKMKKLLNNVKKEIPTIYVQLIFEKILEFSIKLFLFIYSLFYLFINLILII